MHKLKSYAVKPELTTISSFFSSRSRWGSPDVPLPRHVVQLLLGDTKAFPGQMKCVISQEHCESVPGSPSSRTCLDYLPRDASRWHPNHMSGPHRHERAVVLLWGPLQTFKFLSSSQRLRTLILFWCRVHQWTHSFGHNPRLMTNSTTIDSTVQYQGHSLHQSACQSSPPYWVLWCQTWRTS